MVSIDRKLIVSGGALNILIDYHFFYAHVLK